MAKETKNANCLKKFTCQSKGIKLVGLPTDELGVKEFGNAFVGVAVNDLQS